MPDARQDAARRRLSREALEAFARAPEIWSEIEGRLEDGAAASDLMPLLERALARPATIEGTVAAARKVRQAIGQRLSEGERRRLDALEEQVLAGQTGPTLLKGVIYRLARTLDAREVLESTWFDDLFDRVESRRHTDHDAAPA
jgi:hypothetical protein